MGLEIQNFKNHLEVEKYRCNKISIKAMWKSNLSERFAINPNKLNHEILDGSIKNESTKHSDSLTKAMFKNSEKSNVLTDCRLS